MLAIKIRRAAQHPNTLTHRPDQELCRLWNTVGSLEAKLTALGNELAARCQAILDERARCISWGNEQNTNEGFHSYLPYGPLGSDWYACASDWQGRSAKLYAAAAEAAAVLAR